MSTPPAPSVPEKLSFREKLGFGLGDLGNNLFWQFFMYFLLYFYTDIFRIAPGEQAAAVAGRMFFIVRAFDAVFDVVVGIVADRTNTRWGKYRPYLLFGALPFGLAGVLAFTTPDLGATGKIVYAYITYTLLMMVYSAVSIPQNSLLGVIHPDPLQRTILTKYKFVFAFIAGLVVQYCTPILVKHFGAGTGEAHGYQMTLVCYAVVAVAFFFVCFAAIRERVSPPPQQKTSLADDFRDLGRNLPWIILTVATLVSILCIAIRCGTFVYYFKYYVGDREVDTLLWGVRRFSHGELLSAFLVLGTVCTIGGTMLVPTLTRLCGKRTLYAVLMSGGGLVSAAFYFVPADRVGLIFGLQILGSLAMGPTSALLWAMYADCADYSEWTNHRRATGLVFSASIMAQKFGWTLGGWIPGEMLTGFGYVADTALSARTVHGILLMNTAVPAVCGVLAAAIIAFYSLSDTQMKTIAADLQARRAAA